MCYLKQENDSPLQLNTEECTFHFSFYIFLGPLTCSRLKISIALRALSWKDFGLIETKSCGKEILSDILFLFILSTYPFVEGLIIFIDNFLENKNRYIIWRKWFYKNPPRGNSHPKNSHPSKSTLETFPHKIAAKKILTWNIPTHFIICLSSLNTSFWQIFTNVKTSALWKHRITKQSFK